MNDDLRRRLEALADRGEPRGPEAVLDAARRQAGTAGPPRPPMFVAAAIAAAVLALCGVTAVAVHDGGDERPTYASVPASGRNRPGDAGEGLAGGEGGPTTTLPVVDLRGAQLVRYSSCSSLVRSTRREALGKVTAYGVRGLGPAMGMRRGMAPQVLRRVPARALSGAGNESTNDDEMVAGDSSATMGTGGAGPGDSAPSFSGTNTQEQGIDEPDIVDTDGRRLFTLRDERLWYSTIAGAEARIESSIQLLGAREFVLVGDRAVVFGDRSGPTVGSTVTIVDVATPNMGVVASLVFDGMHVSARVVDGVVRAVVRSWPTDFTWTYPEGGGPAEEQAAVEHNREHVRQATRDQWLPDLVIEDGIGRVRADKELVDCNDTYRPQVFSGFGFLTVLTVDPADPDGATSTTVQADGETVYASRDRLYVATTNVDPEAVVRRQTSETLVHTFDIGGRGQARYTGSGKVPGTTMGQFAFSEHEGHLRVATTVNPWDGTSSESLVTVLRHNGDALEQVGQVGGLGRTEEIYAVRFIGPMGYVVTYRRTDPLYVVDIRDPRAPRVVGELKIPGYSAYLHPIGPDLLLGIGQDADEDGTVKGLQVSVFDVADPAAPKRLHQRTFSTSSQSMAEADHHALLWWAATRLAVLPVVSYGDGPDDVEGSAVGLRAGRDALQEVGRIEHPGKPPVERSVVVGSTVFTVSRAGVLAAALTTLQPGKWTPYPS